MLTGFNGKFNSIEHKYRKSGTFTPKLIVKDILGCRDTIVQSPVNFHVYGPTVLFNNTPGNCIHDSISFSDKSFSDGIHPITSWQWDFGDGQNLLLNSGSSVIKHQYNIAADTFKVKLVVYDSYGCKDSLMKSKSIIITDPKAAFGIKDSIVCTQTNAVFRDSSSGLQLNYLWNFGDGAISKITNPTHKYKGTGSYDVSLIITDKFGCADTAFKATAVNISNPKASFILNDTFAVCPPLLIQPQNTSTNYTSLTWNFDDGNTSNSATPVHYYTNGGSYNLTLTVKGYGKCYDTVSKIVYLKGPAGSFSYTPLSKCSLAPVTFNATVKNASKLIWDFNDGNTLNTKNTVVTHKYQSFGKYVPKLILFDNSGCLVSIVNQDTITVSEINAGIKALVNSGCDSSKVSFTDSSTAYYDTLSNYLWKFGDNAVSTLANPVHSYKNTGVYKVQLTVTSKSGCTDTVSVPVSVQVNKSPVINITAPDTTCVLSSVQLKGINTGNDTTISSWNWNYGNGVTDTGQAKTYSYLSAGNYTLALKVINKYGCTDTVKKTISVVAPPVLHAGADTIICLGNTVSLKPSVQPAMYGLLQHPLIAPTVTILLPVL